jgi:hypothetical protein
MKNILLITLIILATSCASRKVLVDKTIIKQDSIVKTNIKTIEKDTTNVEIKKDIVIDEITIKPIDSTKEIIVEGKHYKNVILNIKKTKDNSLIKQSKTTSKIEDKHQSTNIHNTKQTFKKNIEKKINYSIYIWLIVLVFVLYLIWTKKTSLLKLFTIYR